MLIIKATKETVKDSRRYKTITHLIKIMYEKIINLQIILKCFFYQTAL